MLLRYRAATGFQVRFTLIIIQFIYLFQVIVPAPNRLCCYHTIQIINLKPTIPLPYVFIIYLFIYCLVFIIIIYLLFITYYYKVLFYSYLIELLFVEYVATDPIVRGRQ